MEVRPGSMAVPAVQNLHLDQLLQDAIEVLHASESLFASLSAEQLLWKPDRKTWSISECFHHLLIVNGLYISRIEEAIQKAFAEDNVGIFPFKPSWFGRLFIHLLRPESRLKLKTFRIFSPKTKTPDPDITRQFIAQQRVLIELIQRADPCNLNAVKLTSPVSRWIRLSLGEALSAVVVHEQRHLLQAQNIQLHNGFPEFQA